MSDFDLVCTFERLAERKPAFHSEDDLKNALLRQLREDHPKVNFSKETPVSGKRVDIAGGSGSSHRIAIELKYKVAGFHKRIFDEQYTLPKNNPRDIALYDFLRDVARLEQLHQQTGYAGFAVMMSNDKLLWRESGRSGRTYEEFVLTEGRIISGEMHWAARTSEGGKKGRESPIVLIGKYEAIWRNYSDIADTENGLFRYLLFHVHPC